MHIYFSGIGGVALGPLAEIALNAGYAVSGSDLQDSPMLQELSRHGARTHIGQDIETLHQIHSHHTIDWMVYTAALPEDHPELQFAHKHNIRTSKRNELLLHIISENKLKLIAIAGTHGKTTTTAMAVWLFKELGIPVSYSIGSQISFGLSGFFDPRSEYFIYECDEFDRNFLHFHPYLSLITSQDYDHSDTYSTQQEYDDAFNIFKAQSENHLTWKEVVSRPLTLPGAHNRSNASLAIAGVAQLTGRPIDELTSISNTFPGTARRFEKLADNLYSDYGHHPVEIAATLQLAAEISDNVVLVYQPHQNVRQHEIKSDYTNDIFAVPKKVYWLPTYLSREDPTLSTLTPQELTKNIAEDKVKFSNLDNTLWQSILTERKNGALVLLMGAGSIDTWAREQLLFSSK